jgi:hypothetical protein
MSGKDEKPSGLWFLDLEERGNSPPLEYDHSFDADEDAPDRPWFVSPSTPPPPAPEEVERLLGPQDADAAEVLLVEEYWDEMGTIGTPRRSRWPRILAFVLILLSVALVAWAGGLLGRGPGEREPGPGTEEQP